MVEVTAELVKGKELAASIREQVKAAIADRGVTPVLVNVVVGEEEASASYLGAMDRLAGKLGIESRRVTLAADASQDAICDAVRTAGADESVHGLMVQFPLPRGIDANAVADCVPPAKDVDGITRTSLGRVLAGERCHVAPATAAAVCEILAADERLAPEGRDVVVVGRSLVVGRPLAAMLTAPLPGGHATVTVCHTRTKDLAAHTQRADIVVIAAGRQGMLLPEHLSPGVIVVDVGTHPIERDGKWTLAGDADPSVAGVAGFLTPVPGGVGPVTNAVLMRHVTSAALPGYLPEAW
jgi:methylenetetrahydrofolate dehydrogenase (NADP+)/methenyltetrahydrofolate cyclohydrolase